MPINDVTAKYSIIPDVSTCKSDNPQNIGNGLNKSPLIKNIKTLNSGIFANAIKASLYNSINKKYAIERKIDCIIWYIKNDLIFFFINAATIIQINPAIPAVK